MAANKTFKPLFLSAIGRSGTFIIEPAHENEKDNSLEGPSNDQQKATPSVDIKLERRAQASLENDKKESADITNKIVGNTVVAPDRNDEVSPKAETRKGKQKGSLDLSDESTGGKKVYLDETADTKNDGRKGVEPHDTTKNSEAELLVPDVSTKNSKVESADVSCESEQTPEIEPRRIKQVSPDVSAKRSETKTSHVTHEHRYGNRNSVDDVAIKNGEIVQVSPDVCIKNDQTISPDVPSGNFQTELPDDSRANLKTKSLVDAYFKPDQTASPDIAARSKPPDVARITDKSEPPDVGRITDKYESHTPDGGILNDKSELLDVCRITDKSGTPDVLTANNNTAPDLITSRNVKTAASPDVYTTKAQIDSPEVTSKNGDDDSDNTGSQPEKNRNSCSRSSSRAKSRRTHNNIKKALVRSTETHIRCVHELRYSNRSLIWTRDGPDNVVIRTLDSKSTSDGPTELPNPTADEGTSTCISTNSTSAGNSSLAGERLRPIPAPRKSVVKQPDESSDKYELLYKDLCNRWNVVAQVPKFQSIDSKTKAILQEQADRRLMTHCPLRYVEDFRTLIEKVEVALKGFYDQEIIDNSNDKTKNVQEGLPTLQFLQWILPALDEKTQDLLFGCDVMNARIK